MRCIRLASVLCLCILLAPLQVSLGMESAPSKSSIISEGQYEAAASMMERKGRYQKEENEKKESTLAAQNEQDGKSVESYREANRPADMTHAYKTWEAYEELAAIFAAQGKQEEMVIIFEEAINKFLDAGHHYYVWKAYEKLENTFAAQGRHGERIKVLREAIKRFFDIGDIYYAWIVYQELADVFIAQAKLDEGAKVLREAIRDFLDVENIYYGWRAYQKLADALVAHEKQEEAIKVLQEAAKELFEAKNFGYAWEAYEKLKGVFVGQVEEEKVIKAFQGAIRDFLDAKMGRYAWEAYQSAAGAFVAQGKEDKAIELFEETVKWFLNTQYVLSVWEIYDKLIDTFVAQGRQEEAAKALRRIIKWCLDAEDPSNAWKAYQKLEGTFAKQEKMIGMFQEVAKQFLDSRNAYYAWTVYQDLRDAFAAQGKQEEMTNMFQEATRGFLDARDMPNAWALYWQLESIFVAQGKQEEIIKAFQEIVITCLNNTDVSIDKHGLLMVELVPANFSFSSVELWSLFSADLDAITTGIASSKMASCSKTLLFESMNLEQFRALTWFTKMNILDFPLFVKLLVQFMVLYMLWYCLAIATILYILPSSLATWAKEQYLHVIDCFRRWLLLGSASVLRVIRLHAQVVVIYEKIGDIYMRTKCYAEAGQYYSSALSLCSAADNTQLLAKLSECTARVQHHRAILALSQRREDIFYYNIVRISRKALLKSSLKTIRVIHASILRNSKPSIRFVGEMAVDQGGPMRELVTLAFKQFKAPPCRLLVSNNLNEGTYQLNPGVIGWYYRMALESLGRITALAINWSAPIPVRFSSFMLKHMLGKTADIGLEDLAEYDMSVFQGFMNLKEQHIDEKSLEFYVQVAGIDYFPVKRKYVTNENKEEYVKWATKVYLSTSIYWQLRAFLDGFNAVVWSRAIQGLNVRALQLLMNGESVIDVDDWQEHTAYYNCHENDRVVCWFWKTVKSFEQEQLAKLFQFVTSSPRTPVEGLSALEHPFTIWRTSQGDGSYPTASTCFNILYLPSYTTEERLREQLEVVVEHGRTGFGFM